MNKKLSLIILFLLFISLLSVLLAFLAFSKDSGSNQDVGELKTGYEQLSKQVSELKVTTKELDTKVSSNTTSSTTDTTATTTPAQTTEQTAEQNTTHPATTTPQPVTKTISGSKVNMRAVASTTGKIVRQITLGEAVTLTGSTFSSGGYQWVQVKDTKGNTGWLVASYLK